MSNSSEYSNVAPFYDLLLSPFLKNIRRTVIKVVNRLKPKRIIDICCGTGEQLRMLKDRGFKGVGIDLSEYMLNVAAKGNGLSDCFLQDATDTDFTDESFDLAIITLALHETGWEVAENIIKEVNRILSPGGHLLIVDYELSEKSGRAVKLVIRLIERFAGKRHYESFLEYNRNGGLAALVSGELFKPVSDRYKASQSIVMRLYAKI